MGRTATKKVGFASVRIECATVGGVTLSICMGLVDMRGEEMVKHSIPLVRGSPESHHLLTGMSRTAHTTSDAWDWPEVAQDPPPGCAEGLPRGINLG